jgi:hypothetical protein
MSVGIGVRPCRRRRRHHHCRCRYHVKNYQVLTSGKVSSCRLCFIADGQALHFLWNAEFPSKIHKKEPCHCWIRNTSIALIVY